MCYEFANFAVRTYKHERYLSMPNIGDVAMDDLPEADAAIYDYCSDALNDYPSYVTGCGGKLVCLSSEINVCEKCKLEQLASKTTTKISTFLQDVNIIPSLRFTTFWQLSSSQRRHNYHNLLRASPFTCYYENNVISSIARTT